TRATLFQLGYTPTHSQLHGLDCWRKVPKPWLTLARQGSRSLTLAQAAGPSESQSTRHSCHVPTERQHPNDRLVQRSSIAPAHSTSSHSKPAHSAAQPASYVYPSS